MGIGWMTFTLAAWYSGVLFFAWTIFVNIRTGSAGMSGIELLRFKNPIRFWIRIVWISVILFFMATLPVIVIIRNDGSLVPQ